MNAPEGLLARASAVVAVLLVVDWHTPPIPITERDRQPALGERNSSLVFNPEQIRCRPHRHPLNVRNLFVPTTGLTRRAGLRSGRPRARAGEEPHRQSP